MPSETPLDFAREQFRTYMDMPESFVTTASLFTAHTYAMNRLDYAAYVYITSATHQCGKSTFLDLIGAMSYDTTPVHRATPSNIEKVCKRGVKDGVTKPPPTIVMDQVDGFLKREDTISTLCLGNVKRQPSVKQEGNGKDGWGLVQADVFGPKVLAGIRALPDQPLESRCIKLQLERSNRISISDRLRGRILGDISSQLGGYQEWVDELNLLDPRTLGDDFFPDVMDARQIDTWEPLLLIAQAAGGTWLTDAWQAIRELYKPGSKSIDTAEMLLRDIWEVFEDIEEDWISSADLVERLSTDQFTWGLHQTSSGVKWDSERAPIIVAQMLEPFDIRPYRRKRVDVRARGYDRGQFYEAWKRYGIG